MREAVILAGGQSTRLRERLGALPKPLIDINGTPLLGRQLALLRDHSMTRVTILVNYAAEQIRQYCDTNAQFGMQLRLVDEGTPRGTAGAVLAALDRLGDRFVIIYGDTLLNVNLTRFWQFHESSGDEVTLFLHPNTHPHDSDIVEIDEDGRILTFYPYPHPRDRHLPNLVNAALYVVERSALEPWRSFQTPSDFAKQLFPAMLRAGHRMRSYLSFEYVHDIGTPARLDAAIDDLRSGRMSRASLTVPQKAVFTDRDGTLNLKRDYVRTPQELTLIDGVAPAIRRLNGAEFRVVVITNQPVVARGECTFEDLRQIHAKLETELVRSGAFVDRILVCPHHPDRGFPGEVPALKIHCQCRKPGTALIERASRELNIDLAQSWLIGDSSADILAAARVGVRSVLVLTGSAGRDGAVSSAADFVADDFPAAVRFILDGYTRMVKMVAQFLDQVKRGDVILIGGLAKLGKSTLARVVRAELEIRDLIAASVSLDRWIRPIQERTGDVLQRFDLTSAMDTLKPWFDDDRPTRLRLPIYDRLTRQHVNGHDELDLRRGTVLVIEGVPALALAVPPKRRVHRICVVGSEVVRHRRVVSDLVLRGAERTEAQAIYASRQRDEAPVIAGLCSDADWVIDLDAVLDYPSDEH